MGVDIQEIELSNQQKHQIAEIAEQTGRPWQEVLDEQLAELGSAVAAKPSWPDNRYIEDREKRRAHFKEWISRQSSHNPNFDDSRDSIYD